MMALLVFVSTLSFAIESHFCRDILVDSSMFGHVKSCAKEEVQKTCSADCSFIKKDCCRNEKLVVNGQDELQLLSIDKISFDQQVFLVSYFYTYINPLVSFDKKIVSFEEYNSPHVVRCLFKIDETYLI
nr:hypothetical protein [Pustulibacterium marinum]